MASEVHRHPNLISLQKTKNRFKYASIKQQENIVSKSKHLCLALPKAWDKNKSLKKTSFLPA